jgi:hypothetical protein
MSPTSHDRVLHWLDRFYRLTLWVYPSAFRREYGREMTVAFRSRAREIVRVKGVGALAPFVAHITWDWIHSAVTEHNNMTTRMALLRWIAALPVAMLAAYAVMRAVGFAIGVALANPRNFLYVGIGASVGYFSMAAAFVAVGIWVAPNRKESVARIAVAVVGAFGAYAMAVGVFARAFEPMAWGVCILLGGVAGYLPRRVRAARLLRQAES